MEKLTQKKANKVYDLLVSIGGANESDREDFVESHCVDGCLEWRFCGYLGFGGKYKSYTNHVSYYPENETPQIKKIANELNEKLKQL